MGEFFKGWRRKLGVMTMLLACVLLAAWVRSQITVDVVRLPFQYPKSGPVTIDSIISRTNSVSWTRTRRVEGSRLTSDTGLSYHEWRSYSNSKYFERDLSKMRWWVHWLGFHVWDLQIPHHEYSEVHVAIPYWSIVLPLTLLSAYLLLVKPRVAQPKCAIEPIPAKGA